jgi:IS5 family transposase
MNAVVPWGALLSLVEPYYPKVGNGRRPVGLEIMLRRDRPTDQIHGD